MANNSGVTLSLLFSIYIFLTSYQNMCRPIIRLIWVIRVYFLEGIFSRVGFQGGFGQAAILNLCGNSGISIK